jgi:thiol-disulfide isomerase/thioredoxin
MKPGPDRVALFRRIATDFPDNEIATFATGKVRQAEQTGKPFDLSFTDFVTGKKVSMADFRGKVVLVEFWATWCPPCIADLPNIVALHDKYAPKGFTIISVSLDQKPEDGGDRALREFLKQHPHPWPQYYQGNSFEAEFSSHWGINSIPTLFLVDQNGNLHTTHTSRAEEVEPIINDLLNSKK